MGKGEIRMKELNLTEATIKALEGKLLKEDEEDNTPIEGQISFDDVEKEAEEEKKGKYIYETNFRLECPVNDFDEAYNYLTEDDMTQYLDKERCKATPDITSVEWILEDEESGKIVVRAIRELTEDELDELSDWIRGQNSDGLGEGFEQQEFAESYFNPETGDGPYTRREAEREVEKLWEDISVNDLIDNGYLDDAMWEAVEVYKDQNGTYDDNNDEELSDDEIWDIIASDPESYVDWDSIEKAKEEYANGADEYNENNWYVMASFDWKTNDYKLNKVS